MRIWLLLFLLVPTLLLSQVLDSTNLKKNESSRSIYIGSILGSSNTPFWFKANQYGTIPVNTPALHINANAFNTILLKNQNWKFGYGFEVVGNIAKSSQFLLPQAYLKLNFKTWELYVGRRKELFGIADSTIGTGSYSWSGNALPIPKIQLSIPEYRFVRYTRNWVAVKGTFSHGWFGNEKFVNHYFLHQKSFYMRIAKPNGNFKLYGGFTHNAQWGGRAAYEAPLTVGNDFPSSFTDYVYVVMGRNLNYGRIFGKPSPLTHFDSTNRIGNHLGTIDIGFDYEFKKYILTFYRQNIFEDGSLYYLTNIADGLNGLTLRRKKLKLVNKRVLISKLNVEFLYTLSQGGSVAGNQYQVWGKDNYFNHGQFRDGWWYRGRMIGTPFITNRFDSKEEFQQFGMYNGIENANNNRVRVYHVGLEGYYGKNLHFITKLSLSHNYGTYDFPYPETPKQFSGLILLDGKTNWLEGMKWTVTAGFDYGKLYNNSFALQIGLRKTWGTVLRNY